MGKSAIEWTERTWNPVLGCSLVSPGCVNCYAMRQAHRMSGPGKRYEGFTKLGPRGPIWTGGVAVDWRRLEEPIHRRTPSVYFVNSMSDLFHEGLTDDEIASLFITMERSPQHTFQVLTKRAARMRQWVNNYGAIRLKNWPLPNVWLGVSAEDQTRLDGRVPELLATSAAVRFVSAEPLLGPLDLDGDWVSGQGFLRGWHTEPVHGHHGPGGECIDCPVAEQVQNPRLDWVIVGGESGPYARGMDVAWARDVVHQCRSAQVACFVKQMGADSFDSDRTANGASELLRLRDRKGGDPAEWPKDLRVREMPLPQGGIDVA